MSYDAASFMAGLATGRALWRLPYVVPEPLRYSWDADPAWIVDTAGTHLAEVMYFNYPREYYKRYDGKAIGFFRKDQSWQGWNSPVLLSTEPLSVYTLQGSVPYNAEGTFEYLGLTWYYNGGGAVDHPSAAYTTSLHVVFCDGGNAGFPTYVDLLKDILKRAKVRAVWDG